MSKTKDMVIDDQNRKNEQLENRCRDINRLSKETNYQLFSALTEAMRQVAGDRKAGEAICDSELYCDMFSLQAATFARVVKHDRKLQQYQHMEMDQLLKELYQRMQMLHHYGACHSRPLPGIAWTEDSGRFVINLGSCAVNMEHSICDVVTAERDNDRNEYDYNDRKKYLGTLYAIGYDPDIDCESGELQGHYEEALNFLCELNTDDPDATEHRDVTLYHRSWQHKDLLRDILAGIDMIGDMMNEQNENK